MAVSVPFLKLCGLVIGGWLMARAADIAATRLDQGAADREFLDGKACHRAFLCVASAATDTGVRTDREIRQRGVVGTDAAFI